MYKCSVSDYQFLVLSYFVALYIVVIFCTLFFLKKCRIFPNLRRIFKVGILFI